MAPPAIVTKAVATTSATIADHSSSTTTNTAVSSSSPTFASASTAASSSSPVAGATDSETLRTTTTGATASDLPPLHQAAQLGDLTAIHALLSSSNTTTDPIELESLVNSLDSIGVTALHWASINNHYLVCKLLIEKGAQVDISGGELNATPLQWAARNGHVYVVHLLLKHNADPNLLDSQSFNSLHLSIHSSSALLISYMLFTSLPLSVDSSDLEGHTSLHWACYQGDSISVDLLLRAGADPRRSDSAGLTPLHWAAVKGNAACIRRLNEAGADLNIKDHQGKTAKEMATELKSLSAFKRGLMDAGFDQDGRKITTTLSPRNTQLAIFAIPTLTFGIILQSLSILPWWSGLLLAFGEIYGMHHIISKVLLGVTGPHNAERITKSPYLASIITASLIWATYVYLSRFVNISKDHAISQLLCGIGILVCSYNFFRAITLDPGHVPFPVNDSELKETIEDLVEHGNFNGMNFCLTCLVRRPLRSKHSYMTKRCTARFDHYCPWVWNDIGVNNHRQFLIFVLALVFAISVDIKLAYHYFSLAPALTPEEASSCNFPLWLCTAAKYDTLTLVVTFWSGLQMTWTSILLIAQLWQVARQMTSLEVSNVGRHGFMGGKPGVSIAAQQGLVESRLIASALASNAAATGDDAVESLGSTPGGSSKPIKKAGFLLRILGIDRFTTGGAAQGLAKSGIVSNPFDLGLWGNCKDFWSRGKELDVDYQRLFDLPEGGFRKSVRDRKRREKEEKGTHRVGNSADGSGARKGRATGGYERLAMDEV